MSRRNSREEKKKRKVLHALRQTPPAWIDLIDYIKLRTRCTTGMAQKVILSGALMVDDTVVGFVNVEDPLAEGGKRKQLVPRVPAEVRDRIVVRQLSDSDFGGLHTNEATKATA